MIQSWRRWRYPTRMPLFAGQPYRAGAHEDDGENWSGGSALLELAGSHRIESRASSDAPEADVKPVGEDRRPPPTAGLDSEPLA
jgi:hypothetical protein